MESGLATMRTLESTSLFISSVFYSWGKAENRSYTRYGRRMPVHGSYSSRSPLLNFGYPLTMPLNSATDDSSSIFRNGKLKPGVYKIQNLYSQAYLDIHEHSRETCCR